MSPGSGAAPAPGTQAQASAAACPPCDERDKAADQGADDDEPSDATAEMGGEYRRLNGHNFISPFALPSAFLNTSITTQQGFGVLQFEAPDLINGGTRSSQIFAYAQQLGGQIGIANRVAIEAYATGVAALGTAIEDILGVGALADLSVGGGAKVRIVSSEAAGFQLTAGAFAQYDRTFNIRPGGYLQAILAGLPTLPVPPSEQDFQDLLRDSEDALIVQQEAAELAPAIMMAEGVGPFAIQVAGVPTFPIAGENTSVSIEAGGQLEFDFAALTQYFPIALAGGYAMDYRFEESDLSHQVNAGLLYSGRRDLSLGVIAGYAPDPDVSLITGVLALQYFF